MVEIDVKLTKITQVALEIYGGCNYRCKMCPQDGGRHKDFLRKMPFDVFKKVVDDAVDHGCTTVSLHGSGEATLHPEIAKFVKYVKSRGLTCVTVSNGYMLDDTLVHDLIEAGLDYIRVSGIGYDRDSYLSWMKKDSFNLVRDNVRNLERRRIELKSPMRVGLYHLILDPLRVEEEIGLYRRNWVDYCGGVEAEVWMMHNWAGSFKEVASQRITSNRRSCGRPNAPYLNVRAGGLSGASASVVPCCFVLGRDEDAVLGRLDSQTIQEVLDGQPFKALKEAHAVEQFDKIPYCKDCDQLYDTPDALVWTNIAGKRYGQSKALFDLDYRAFARQSDTLPPAVSILKAL